MADTKTDPKPGEGKLGTKPVIDGVAVTFGAKATIGGIQKTIIGWVWPCMGTPTGAVVTLEDAGDIVLSAARLTFVATAVAEPAEPI